MFKNLEYRLNIRIIHLYCLLFTDASLGAQKSLWYIDDTQYIFTGYIKEPMKQVLI